MTKKRTVGLATVKEIRGQFSLNTVGGGLFAYRTIDGHFYLHTRYATDQGYNGLILQPADLIALAAALTRLAQDDERTA